MKKSIFRTQIPFLLSLTFILGSCETEEIGTDSVNLKGSKSFNETQCDAVSFRR